MNRERMGQAFTRWANWLDELIWRLDGYAVIPHELLHALAYRIVQKPYHYRLGNHIVSPLSSEHSARKSSSSFSLLRSLAALPLLPSACG